MTSLTVKLKAPPDQRWTSGVAVEVRDVHKHIVRARSLCDTAIEVPPGRYLVMATLPDGQQAGIDEPVEVGTDEDKHVLLSLDDLQLPPVVQATPPAWSDAITEGVVWPVVEFLGFQSAALVHGKCWPALKPAGTTIVLRRTALVRSTLDVTFADQPVLLEVGGRRSANNTYIAIPVDKEGTTTVHWENDQATGRTMAKFNFNGPFNAFFDYVHAGLGPQARSLSRTLVRQAESYVDDKGNSAVRAALAAYVLLRANELDGLDTSTLELMKKCPWLPDVVPIRMEYLARRARHEEAIALLTAMPTDCVPWFRSGIIYAAARAKRYASLGRESASRLQINPQTQASLEKMATALGQVAEAVDLAQTVTVLRDLPRVD